MSLFHSKLSKAPYHHKDQSEPSFQWPTGRFKPSPSPPSDFSSYVIPHSFLSSLINFHAAPQACQAVFLQAGAYAIPSARNSFPPDMCPALSLASFRSQFKCHHVRKSSCDCPISIGNLFSPFFTLL